MKKIYFFKFDFYRDGVEIIGNLNGTSEHDIVTRADCEREIKILTEYTLDLYKKQLITEFGPGVDHGVTGVITTFNPV